MNYFSVCSGIGGFELGIYQADKESTCVGYSEVDQYACKIYNSHFHHTNYGDITKITASELPDFDLLVGGFPCQAFSIAGKRRGFDDTRGTVFFDIARILKCKTPRLFLLENVKGLLSHDGGNTFKLIVSTLTELGYDLQWQVLNSKNHGVPQNRERVFIVGHTRGSRRPEVFPLGESDSRADEARSEAKQVVAHTLRAKQGGPDLENSYFIRETEDGFHTARNDKKQSSIQGTHVTYPQGKSNCFNTAHIPMTLIENKNIRRLTPTECERLQGFPDGWTNGISDTQRYKTLGNAVTVNVVRDVIQKML